MTKFALLCAGAFALATLPATASEHGGESQQGQQQGMEQGQQQLGSGMDSGNRSIDVMLGFIRGADVVGAEGEEVGDIVEIVRPTGDQQGLSAVINVETGWFDEERQLVAALNRFTITEEGYLRLDGATEDTIDQFDEYVEEDWELVGEDYETFDEAYEGYGWEW